jgi:hypothetical protein
MGKIAMAKLAEKREVRKAVRTHYDGTGSRTGRGTRVPVRADGRAVRPGTGTDRTGLTLGRSRNGLPLLVRESLGYRTGRTKG